MLTLNELREYLNLCIIDYKLTISKISKESGVNYDILLKFKNKKRGLGYENSIRLHQYLEKLI